jgi:hypothetical protein
VFKGGLYRGEQRTEKSTESSTEVEQAEKGDAEGEKGC